VPLDVRPDFVTQEEHALPLTLSCAFATSLDSHEHARIAESLGYERAFFYDSPALYPDVWVQLCRAAERTDRIGLGPGVLVPSNRHPMTSAAAIATLAALAGPERVTVAVG
jgi:5,10-methylenetetrahydromethanopterin reductase